MSEANFWNWFEANQFRIVAAISQAEPNTANIVVAHVQQELSKVKPGLGFLVSGERDGVREFVITANGKVENIPAVKSLVAIAPLISGWKIVPFRPRMPVRGMKLNYRGGTLSADEVWFQAFRGPNGELGITLLIKDLTQQNYNERAGAALLMLDHALGEFDSLTKIRSLIADPLSSVPKDANIRAFEEIASFIDGLKTTFVQPVRSDS